MDGLAVVSTAVQVQTAHISVRKRPRSLSSNLTGSSDLRHPSPKRGQGWMRTKSPSQAAWMNTNIPSANRPSIECAHRVTASAAAPPSSACCTSNSAASTREEIGPVIFQHRQWEPTSPLTSPDFAGVEIDVSTPSARLDTELEYIVPSSFLPGLTGYTNGSPPYWSSMNFDFSAPIPFPHVTYPFCDSEVPPQLDYLDNYQCVAGRPFGPFQMPISSGATMPSPGPHNPFQEPGSLFVQYEEFQRGDLSGDTSMPNQVSPVEVANPDDSDDYCLVSGETSGDETGQPNREASPRSSTSQLGEKWSIIPWITDEPQEENSSDSESANVANSTPKRRPPGRRPLNPEKRRQTGLTRQLTACVRCQMQRIRCKPNPNPEHAKQGFCETCLSVSLDSKKVIHKFPCERWKITSTILFRHGGLKLTKRWEGVAMRDLGDDDWVDGPAYRTIHMSQGLGTQGVVLNVKKFKPLLGDVTAREWRDGYGNPMRTEIKPYAIASIYKAAKSYKQFIREYAAGAFLDFARRPNIHPLVAETYEAAYYHIKTVSYEKNKVNIQVFMDEFLQMWLAMRWTIGSAWLEGDEKLDMVPDTRPGYPYQGKVSVPRMVCQQFDALNYAYVLNPLRKKVLANLWKLIHGKDPKCFYTVYLVIFVLLHEASSMSKDAWIHARDKNHLARYNLSIASDVEDVQEGTNILLIFWHYYKRQLDPMSHDWENTWAKCKKKNLYQNTDPAAVNLMMKLCKAESQGNFETDSEKELNRVWGRLDPQYTPLTWERDLHFVSQMFKVDWTPEDNKTWRM